jgi:hypothetical protein
MGSFLCFAASLGPDSWEQWAIGVAAGMAIYITYVLVDMFKWHKDCPDHIEHKDLAPAHDAGVVHVTRKDLGDTPGTAKAVGDTSEAKDVADTRGA